MTGHADIAMERDMAVANMTEKCDYSVKMREERDTLFEENKELKRKLAEYEKQKAFYKIAHGFMKYMCEEVDHKTAYESNRMFQHNDRYWLYPEGFSPFDALHEKY